MAEFNEIDTVEAALANENACVLMEPALTNIGIVLPEDGFLAAVRDACTRTGTLLIIDETYTLSAGPGGCTAAWGLEPDAVTLGKSIGGGVPIGTYGVSAELAARIAAAEDADLEDTGGGGTLAGNALSLAATRHARRGPDPGSVRPHGRAARALRGRRRPRSSASRRRGRS